MTASPDRFIVAEINKNWPQDREPRVLCELFENVINFNAARGYRLLSFQLARVMVSPTFMSETIIAVFEYADPPEPR